MLLKGISPEIDSCVGMIRQQAAHTYRHISPIHRRWLDPEDLIQEGLLAAVQTSQKFDPCRHLLPIRSADGSKAMAKPIKYSSYLHNGLHFHLSKIASPLRQQKRVLAGVLELDAPKPEGRSSLQLPDTASTPEEIQGAVTAFLDLCMGMPAPGVILLVRGFVLGTWAEHGLHQEIQIITKISEMAEHKGTSPLALRLLSQHQEAQKMLLTQLVESDIIDLGHDMDARILECTNCAGMFPLVAIRTGRFVVPTMTCKTCYTALEQSPLACFGKQYSTEAVECRLHCPDRYVCRAVSQNQSGVSPMTSEATAQAAEDLKDVDLSDVQPTPSKKKPAKAKPNGAAQASAPSPAKKKAAAKPEPKPKAAKPAKQEEDPPPPECGPRWPFKRNSIRGYAFARALKGVKASELKEIVEKQKFNWDLVLRNLRRAPHTSAAVNRTHTWSLSEEGGRLKIHSVKYIGEKKKKA